VGADLAGGTPGLHGFPGTLSSFVGRSETVREVAGLLGTNRLVTVLGPGGVGKTRLAGEVGRQVATRFADGVWLVELAAVTDPDRIPAAVTAALQVPPRPGMPDTAVLAAALTRRQLLIVLDNCEHVIQAAAELCLALLPGADDVQVLATSREPFGLPGETRYRLGPLAVPEPGHAAGASESEILFADRARQADPGFVLDDRTLPLVSRLVRRLDGLPLALELAAARVDSLGLEQLLGRLDDRLSLLSGADRLAAARHRSLGAMVEWSYQLLSPEEQWVFRQLSAFPGGFSLDGAAAVAGAGAIAVVVRLVDCSLVAPPAAGVDGRSRYLMLDTLRTYGAQRLAGAGEQADARAALARYAVTVAEEAAVGLAASPGERAAVRWLDAEEATVRRALDWAADHDRPMLVRLVIALGPWWHVRGRLADAGPLLQAAAASAEPPGDQWCAVQFWLALVAHTGGDFTAARDIAAAVVRATSGGPPRPLLADVLAFRAQALAHLGQITEGLEDGCRAVALARELGYLPGEAIALANQAIATYFAGDLETALAQARRSTQLDRTAIPGWVARRASLHLALLLADTDDLRAAGRACRDALGQARDLDDRRGQARFLNLLATLDLRAGQLPAAGRWLRESLDRSARMGEPVSILNDLDTASLLAAATGRPAEAITLWAAMIARAGDLDMIEVPEDVRRREPSLRRARAVLGAAASRRAGQRGEAMTLATAAELAAMIAVSSSAGIAAGAVPGGGPKGRLSPRERDLITLVAQGWTDAQIAAELFISVRTVRSHLDRIRDKTDCRRRADLTRLALEEGLV
jgi:predicted ATPase/DNA-binding CsgD family transcriptional regulator